MIDTAAAAEIEATPAATTKIKRTTTTAAAATTKINRTTTTTNAVATAAVNAEAIAAVTNRGIIKGMMTNIHKIVSSSSSARSTLLHIRETLLGSARGCVEDKVDKADKVGKADRKASTTLSRQWSEAVVSRRYRYQRI